MNLKIAALGLIMGLVLGLPAGCGNSRDDSPAAEKAPPSASSGPAAGEAAAIPPPENRPDYGDTLITASIGEPSNLIPALASDSASRAILQLVYNGLVKIDRDLNLAPDLAESWEVSQDQLTITFRLRKGVKWHDGAPFTARDCLFTYQLMADPLTPTAYAEDFKQIEKAEILDDYTFRVTYSRPFAQALLTWSFSIMPAHLLEGRELPSSPLARKPTGTGPYKLTAWEPGQRLVLDSNRDYFEGRPYIDRHITRIIPDQSTQLLELQTGGIDYSRLTPDQYRQKTKESGFTSRYHMFHYPDFSYTYLGFNLKDERFKDARVRRAIALAIDKDELVEGVLSGLGRPANGPYRQGMWAYNPEVEPYPFDPEKARALLAEAGWKDTNGDGVLDKNGRRLEFTILINQGNRVREQAGVIIQERLSQVGIRVKLRVVEWAALLKEYLDKGKFEAIIMGWTIPLDPDLYDVWHSSKTRPGELNFTGYNNPEIDRLIDKGRFNLDIPTRQQAYFQIQEIFYQDVPCVFLFVPDALPVISSRFIGPEETAAGVGINQNWWYVPKAQQKY